MAAIFRGFQNSARLRNCYLSVSAWLHCNYLHPWQLATSIKYHDNMTFQASIHSTKARVSIPVTMNTPGAKPPSQRIRPSPAANSAAPSCSKNTCSVNRNQLLRHAVAASAAAGQRLPNVIHIRHLTGGAVCRKAGTAEAEAHLSLVCS